MTLSAAGPVPADSDRPAVRPSARPSVFGRWARAERPLRTRVAVMVLVAPVFLVLLPLLVTGLGPAVDRRLGLPPPRLSRGRVLAGGSVMAAGFGLAFWSIDAQLGRGRGTPLPVLPTQELLTDGPFRYSRNPMTLGAVLAYLGMAVAAGTAAGAGIVLALGGGLLAYLKGVEERELAERFGEAYLEYRRRTPFLVPRAPRLRR